MALTRTDDGSTPLSPEEMADLIPNLATKDELNEWERENILQAREWARAERTEPLRMPSDNYIRKLHRKMFDQTWKWAGEYRHAEKNLGVRVEEIRDRLMTSFGEVRYWIENNTHPPNEIAVRFHHRLVLIHPFPHGNGRHARLVADALTAKLGGDALTWGAAKNAANLLEAGEVRRKYLEALRAADSGDLELLLQFARS
jgi:Fic-DOC domain mobile mystery protein B